MPLFCWSEPPDPIRHGRVGCDRIQKKFQTWWDGDQAKLAEPAVIKRSRGAAGRGSAPGRLRYAVATACSQNRAVRFPGAEASRAKYESALLRQHWGQCAAATHRGRDRVPVPDCEVSSMERCSIC